MLSRDYDSNSLLVSLQAATKMVEVQECISTGTCSPVVTVTGWGPR